MSSEPRSIVTRQARTLRALVDHARTAAADAGRRATALLAAVEMLRAADDRGRGWLWRRSA